MIFPLDNRHFITDSIYYYLERYSSFSYIQTQKGYSLLHMCRPFSSTDIKRCSFEHHFLSKKQAENPHLNIEYSWGMNAVNASDREIWSKK